MGTGGNDCIGLAPDGITDAVAICQDAPDPTPRASRPPGPACVIMPQMPGELPLAGDGAFESLDGRGWDPHHARARQPILPLLLGLEGSAGTGAEEAGHWLAAHLRALGGAPGARHIVAVPDCLGELGQQRLLDALRRANIPAELLWRPIATVLGWACRLSAAEIEALHGKSVLVVHLGFWAPELSLIRLEAEEHQNRRWLIPIRDGRGLAPPAGLGWPIESTAMELMTADLARVGLSPADVDPSLVWLSRRPWTALCCAPLPKEIIRDRKGCWYRLGGALDPPNALAASLTDPIHDLLRRQAASPAQVHRVLIDGPLTRLNVGPMSFGDQLAERLRRLGTASADVDVLPIQLSATASGAAHYGWRRREDIPGYYDTVPDLEINACVSGRPVFVSLMEGQNRVVGGRTIGPKEISGFSIESGAKSVQYYLARADEPTVRKTDTTIPEPPEISTKLILVVKQTPGQGFAEVEVRAAERGRLGLRPVFLDWRLMDDTTLTRDEVVRELSGQCMVAYPDPAPVACHATVWCAYNLPSRIHDFLGYMRGLGFGPGPQRELAFQADHGTGAVGALRTALSSKPTAKSLRKVLARGNRWSMPQLLELLPDDDKKFGAVSSEGATPAEDDLIRLIGRPPAGYKSYRELFDEFVAVTNNALASVAAARGGQENLRNRLLVMGAWCYTAAAPTIIGEIRSVLFGSAVIAAGWQQKILTAAGRCLNESDDIAGLFHKVHHDRHMGQPDVPLYRIVSAGQILAYRQNAPMCLSPDIAFGLAGIALETMAAQRASPKNKFLSAAALLMMLLRYRVVDPGFLNPSNEHHQPFVARINAILEQPLDANL
jgi:hypothetical protein